MYLQHEGNSTGDISPSWGQPNTRVHIHIIEAPRTPRSRGMGRGRAASKGALAPEPPRATRITSRCIRILSKNTLFFHFSEFSLKLFKSHALVSQCWISTVQSWFQESLIGRGLSKQSVWGFWGFHEAMMMIIAFITFNSSWVPLIKGLCSSNPWEFELHWMNSGKSWVQPAELETKNLQKKVEIRRAKEIWFQPDSTFVQKVSSADWTQIS